jgi:hypothetical protein
MALMGHQIQVFYETRIVMAIAFDAGDYIRSVYGESNISSAENINVTHIASGGGGSVASGGGGGGSSVSCTYPNGGVVYNPAYPPSYISTASPWPLSPLLTPPPGVWGGSTEDMEWVKKPMKLNKQQLTPADIDKLIQTCCTTVKKNETLIVCVDEDTPASQMQDMVSALANYAGIKGFVMSKPANLDTAGGKVRSEEDRIDILARIGVIWEHYPHLRLGQLIAMVMVMDNDAENLYDIEDYPLVVALETAFGATKRKKST